MKNIIVPILMLLSIALLIPGVVLPMMTITVTVNKQDMVEQTAEAMIEPVKSNQLLHAMLESVINQLHFEGAVKVFESTQSLTGTMNELFNHGHILVALLIGLFGLLVPLLKIVILFSSIYMVGDKKQAVLAINSLLSKWSMSDVFVMAIFIAFMAVNANGHRIDTVTLQAKLEPGFYFFMVYCVFSVGAGQYFYKLAKLPC